MPVTWLLFSKMWRWSVSSFCGKVELVDHSSPSSPPNSQVLSLPAVMLRNVSSAPFDSPSAPSALLSSSGGMLSGMFAWSSESVTLEQAASASPIAAMPTAVRARSESRLKAFIGQYPTLMRKTK